MKQQRQYDQASEERMETIIHKVIFGKANSHAPDLFSILKYIVTVPRRPSYRSELRIVAISIAARVVAHRDVVESLIP
jgi:hypothetical protein